METVSYMQVLWSADVWLAYYVYIGAQVYVTNLKNAKYEKSTWLELMI